MATIGSQALVHKRLARFQAYDCAIDRADCPHNPWYRNEATLVLIVTFLHQHGVGMVANGTIGLRIGAAALAGVLALPTTADATLLDATVAIAGVYGTLPLDYLGAQIITAGGAFYAATPNTGTDFLVLPTQITLTNRLGNTPFCTVGTLPCPDTFDGFTFQFDGTPTPGILGVTVDPASAADFLPISLTLTSPTAVSLNLVGDSPVLGDQLILDLVFTPPGPLAPVSEPASAALLGAALLGMSIANRSGRGRVGRKRP